MKLVFVVVFCQPTKTKWWNLKINLIGLFLIITWVKPSEDNFPTKKTIVNGIDGYNLNLYDLVDYRLGGNRGCCNIFIVIKNISKSELGLDLKTKIAIWVAEALNNAEKRSNGPKKKRNLKNVTIGKTLFIQFLKASYLDQVYENNHVSPQKVQFLQTDPTEQFKWVERTWVYDKIQYGDKTTAIQLVNSEKTVKKQWKTVKIK